MSTQELGPEIHAGGGSPAQGGARSTDGCGVPPSQPSVPHSSAPSRDASLTGPGRDATSFPASVPS